MVYCFDQRIRGFPVNILSFYGGGEGGNQRVCDKHTVPLASKKILVLCCSTAQCHVKGFIKAWSQEYRRSMKVAIQLATAAAPRLVEKVCPLRVVLPLLRMLRASSARLERLGILSRGRKPCGKEEMILETHLHQDFP